MESTKGIGQRDMKGATKDCFIFDSWLYSNNSEEDVMEFGADLISMVKKYTKIMRRDNSESYKGLARRLLTCAGEQAYGTWGQAYNFYWLQV